MVADGPRNALRQGECGSKVERPQGKEEVRGIDVGGAWSYA